MANWSDLKEAVASIVKTNGNKEITGQLLQNVLNNIISNVGLNSSFAGIATPETNPGTPDGNVFYLATTAGTYSNFNGIVIEAGETVILEWKGSWVKKELGYATKEKLSDLGSKIEAETNRATAAELELRKSINNETIRAKEAEEELENSINANRYGYNVTVHGLKGGIHTIETAIKDVPSKFRMLGQKITFRTENGDWATYHNESLSLDNYENVNDWVQEIGISSVTGDINISNNPDYEDLTEASDGTIKFADKEYSKDSFSGLGRVYLRKNIVDGVNVLTQDMISKENTIYIIQYDYDLQGAEITIPEGCVLDFQGGNIGNGVINGIYRTIGINNSYQLNENDWVVASQIGFIKNSEEHEFHNYNLFKQILEHKLNLELDGIYYISNPNYENVENDTYIDYFDYDFHIKGGKIKTKLLKLMPLSGASFYAEGVEFECSTLAIKCSLLRGRPDYLIDTISFKDCIFNHIKVCSITGVDIDASVNDFGIKNFIVEGCKGYNFDTNTYPEWGISTYPTHIVELNNIVYKEVCNISNNDISDIRGTFLYIATDNSYSHANSNKELSCVINITNNNFKGAKVVEISDYHCAVLAEANTIVFSNNNIDNFVNIIDAKQYEGGTAYDSYLSCSTLKYCNNNITNIMSSRKTEETTAYKPLCEIFKSKGVTKDKYIVGNTVTIDENYLLSLGIKVKDMWAYFMHSIVPTENCIVSDNIITSSGSSFYITGKSGSWHVKNFTFSNNIIRCSKVNDVLVCLSGGQFSEEECKYVFAKNIFDVSSDVSTNITLNNNGNESLYIEDNWFSSNFEYAPWNTTSIKEIIFKNNTIIGKDNSMNPRALKGVYERKYKSCKWGEEKNMTAVGDLNYKVVDIVSIKEGTVVLASHRIFTTPITIIVSYNERGNYKSEYFNIYSENDEYYVKHRRDITLLTKNTNFYLPIADSNFTFRCKATSTVVESIVYKENGNFNGISEIEIRAIANDTILNDYPYTPIASYVKDTSVLDDKDKGLIVLGNEYAAALGVWDGTGLLLTRRLYPERLEDSGSLAKIPDPTSYNLSHGYFYFVTDTRATETNMLGIPTFFAGGGRWVDGIGRDVHKIPPKSGTFANKPNTTSHEIVVGQSYFCTDRQTTESGSNGIMIYYKGNNVWVDALGRVVE